jgi:hypothetical protein
MLSDTELEKLREAVGGQRPGNPNVWDNMPGASRELAQQGQQQPLGLLSFVRNPTQQDCERINQEQHIMILGLGNQPRLKRGEHFYISVAQVTPVLFNTVSLLAYIGQPWRHALHSRPLFEYRDWVGATVVFGRNPDGAGMWFCVKEVSLGRLKAGQNDCAQHLLEFHD